MSLRRPPPSFFAKSAAAVVVVAALMAGGRAAHACTMSSQCTGITPVCSGGTCVPCSATNTCPAMLVAQVCQADGRCTGKCGQDYGGTNVLLTACPQDLPFCDTGSGNCHSCDSGHPTCVAGSSQPVCTSAGVCGCADSTQCATSFHCDPAAGIGGQCVTGCSNGNQCTSPTAPVCALPADGGAGECVQCSGAQGCTGQASCDDANHLCVLPDAGGFVLADAGGPGASGDGGVSGSDGGIGGGDGGSTTTGGGGSTGAGGAGDGGGDSYGDGRLEGGGGCAIPSGEAAGTPLTFGLFALGGLFAFGRRWRRRASSSPTEPTEPTEHVETDDER